MSVKQLIKSELEFLESRWNKLLIVCGKTSYKANDIAIEINVPYINLNLMLSEKLTAVSKSKYPFQVREILESILEEQQSNTYWLGDIEILFDKQLRQNPVRLLEQLGKKYKLVISWLGKCSGRNLTYATPEHPEFFNCNGRVDLFHVFLCSFF
jgi:hypothetical protein